MWKLYIPSKVKLIACLPLRKRLNVRSHLNRLLPHINLDGPLCNNAPETIDYLFLTCSFANNIWSCVNDNLLKPPISTDLLTWLDMLPTTNSVQGPCQLSKAIMICCT